jgi:hypothetical protein
MCLLAAVFVLLLRCNPVGADVFVRDDIITDPAPSRFSVCHGFTCALVTEARLTDAQWFAISSVFERAADTPEQEREQIALAIARFETMVGPLTGTSGDLPENQVKGMDRAGQMDCIDESTNTTTYLRILAKAGLLSWHRVEDRITRGWFLFGWPHTTAVVRDRQSGRLWAVDSWFFANGQPPAIVPVDTWRQARWRPEKPPVAVLP